MKLRREPGHEGPKRALKSNQVVGRAEHSDPGLEFDVVQVVGRQIWERLDRCLNAHREMRSRDELPFVRLVAFDPERRLRAEQIDELPGQIQLTIFDIARYEVDPDLAVNTELARYIDFFPQVTDGLDDSLAPTPHDLNKSLASFDGYSRIDHAIEEVAPEMRALIQLFPEQKDLVFQKIEQLQFWEKALKGAQDLSRVPGEALNHLPAILANLAFIFPDKKEDLLKIIRPRWNQLRNRLSVWGRQLDMELDDPDPEQRPMIQTVTSYVDNILGMAYLSELSKQDMPLKSVPKLPERFTA